MVGAGGRRKAKGFGRICGRHRLDEIVEVAGRVAVLGDGGHVGTKPIGEFTRDSMIELMVGRSLDQEFPKAAAELGEERLVVRGLSRGRRVREVSFGVRRGWVPGRTGPGGAGRAGATAGRRAAVGASRWTRASSLMRPRRTSALVLGGSCSGGPW